jgi:hypothetical protein
LLLLLLLLLLLRFWRRYCPDTTQQYLIGGS